MVRVRLGLYDIEMRDELDLALNWSNLGAAIDEIMSIFCHHSSHDNDMIEPALQLQTNHG